MLFQLRQIFYARPAILWVTSENLIFQTRQKVIVAAFLRALRDPFPPARMAGINALCATLEFTAAQECATRVMPALCNMTIDPDKSVRDHVSMLILIT